MKSILAMITILLSVSVGQSSGKKGILCWAVDMNNRQYLFDQQKDHKPTDTLLDKVRVEKNNFVFSASLVSAEFGQPTMVVAVEDKTSGINVGSTQFKLGFADIAANSYGSATFENTKDRTKIQLICKTVEKNAPLPGNVN